EGTGLTHGISTLIAEKAEDWVDGIIKLYDDEMLWQKFAENQNTLVKANFSFENGKNKFRDIFAFVGLFSTLDA
uniref:hypothetical protein n=1 Tax=Winogradskyella sp. TaxID=1883156 RepID=UPI003AA8C697